MSLREERMAKNEAASREINEKIQEAYQGEPAANRIDIVCECARMTCDAAIDIALDEYEDAREDALHFMIIPGHFVGDIEWIVYENCLLYTSDAADERSSVDLGGRRII